MRKYIKYFVLLFMVSIFNSIGAKESYYYYNGKKKVLNVNEQFLTITCGDKRYINNISNLAGIKDVKLLSNVDENIFLLKIDESQYDRLYNILKSIKEISSVEPVFDETNLMTTSNYFYIKLKNEDDVEDLYEISKKYGASVIGSLSNIKMWYKLKANRYSPYNSIELSNLFYETGLFADVDPDFAIKYTSQCVTDNRFGEQWAIDGEGIDINVCDVWTRTTGTNDVKMAIIDTGVDHTHNEFEMPFGGSFDCFYGESFTNALLYGDINETQHGTAVAGVIFSSHDAFDIAGVAPQLTILSTSTPINDTPYSSAYLADCIYWAVNNGADVLNCSWGAYTFDDEYYQTYKSSMLEGALSYALNSGRSGKGCIVVFASGNDGFSQVNYPGRIYPAIINVGSINSNGLRSSYSNYGSDLDLVAPGESILTTQPYDGYVLESGTSFAAPYVSGVAGLILSVNPYLTVDDVVKNIELTTQKLSNYSFTECYSDHTHGSWNSEVGYGLLDASMAVSISTTKYIQNKTYIDRVGTNDTIVNLSIAVGQEVNTYDVCNQGEVTMLSGSHVVFIAENEIRFEDGFEMNEGAELEAFNVGDIATLVQYDNQHSVPHHILNEEDKHNITTNNETIENTETRVIYNIESSVISIMGKQDEYEVNIFHANGQKLLRTDNRSIDISDFPQGIYIVNVQSRDGDVYNGKIIKY